MRYLWILGLALIGCSGDDEPGAVDCSKADRNGTYLFEYAERDGTCGAVPDSLGRLDASADIPANCIRTAADVWSADECKLERSAECTVAEDGLVIHATAVTSQTDDSGEVLSGLYSVTARDLAGNFVCSGTYDLTATRQ